MDPPPLRTYFSDVIPPTLYFCVFLNLTETTLIEETLVKETVVKCVCYQGLR